MIRILLTSLLFMFMTTVLASNSTTFNNEIYALYNFSPHTLSQKEIEEKSKLLDVFWKKVTTQPKKYKQRLRDELRNNNHVPYFYYDGSKLLLSISDNKEDKILALKSIQKANLKDIQSTDYLLTVTILGLEGLDTSDAAFHILSNSNFKAFIVQHALTLGQDYSLVSMLIPINEDLYIEKALKRIKTETNDTALKSLLKLLWYADTPRALKAISNISNDTKYSKTINDLSDKLANETKLQDTIPEDKLKRLYKTLNIRPNVKYNELKSIRMRRFNRISDEALIELDQLTFLMKRQRVVNAL